MKKIRVLTIILFISIIPILCLCGWLCCRRDYNKMFLNNWGIQLPDNMKEKFRKFEDNWGPGAISYAVFELKHEPKELTDDFTRESDRRFENEVNNILVAADFKIEKEYLPDWNAEYYFKQIDVYYDYISNNINEKHCYMIYFPQELKLAICQNTMQ